MPLRARLSLPRLAAAPQSTRTFASSARTMTSADSKTNASGLTPTESKQLRERQPNDDEKSVLQGIRDLYTVSPTSQSYSMYAQAAVFHDPVSIAEGVESIKAQFNGLVKVFPRATLDKFRVLENPATLPKSTILVDQDVSYYRKTDDKEPFKTLNSLLALERDAQGKVTKHSEEWEHKSTSASDDGFFGMLNEARKKATAGIVNAAVDSTPPSERK